MDSKDNMDMAMKSFGAVSKTFQASATEVTDYSKKSLEDSTAAFEKLMGAKSLEKAIEGQTEVQECVETDSIAGSSTSRAQFLRGTRFVARPCWSDPSSVGAFHNRKSVGKTSPFVRGIMTSTNTEGMTIKFGPFEVTKQVFMLQSS